MIEPTWLALGLVLPALLAAAAVVAALQPGRDDVSANGVALGWILALTAGTLIGIVATFGPPAIKPPDPATYRWQDALFALVLALGLVEFVSRFAWWFGWITWPLRIAIVVAAPLLLLWPIARNEPAPDAGWALGWQGLWPVLTGFADSDPRRWWPLLVLGLLLLVFGGAGAAHAKPGRDLPPALGLAAVGAGVTLALSGSLSIGQIALTLGGLAAGGGLVVLVARRDVASAGLATMLLFVYGCALIVGYFYTYDAYNSREGLDHHHAITLAAAPLLAGLASLPLPKSIDRPWFRATLRLLLTLVPVAIVVAIAARRFMAAEADPYA